jgi:hypothetical protein
MVGPVFDSPEARFDSTNSEFQGTPRERLEKVFEDWIMLEDINGDSS